MRRSKKLKSNPPKDVNRRHNIGTSERPKAALSEDGRGEAGNSCGGSDYLGIGDDSLVSQGQAPRNLVQPETVEEDSDDDVGETWQCDMAAAASIDDDMHLYLTDDCGDTDQEIMSNNNESCSESDGDTLDSEGNADD